MSTDLSSPSSNTSEEPVFLPWEMLGHIFSFCDQPTLVALSLVSFGCWELAGPILYQDVEIVDLDGLASLLFIDVAPSSPRLQQATSLLSRIQTLFLDGLDWNAPSTSFFTHPIANEEGVEALSSSQFRLPHRLLLAFTTSSLPLDSLLLPGGVHSIGEMFGFLALQVFPYLSPVKVVHLSTSTNPWFYTSSSCSTAFLARWTRLETVVWLGLSIVVTPWPSSNYREDPLYSFLPPEGEEGRRSLQLVFDFASREEVSYDAIRGERDLPLSHFLKVGGVKEPLSKALDLRVVVGARREEEKLMKQCVERELEDWMKKLVVVEVV